MACALLVEPLDTVGAEAELADVAPLFTAVVEVVDVALVVCLDAVDDVLAELVDDVVPPPAVEVRVELAADLVA